MSVHNLHNSATDAVWQAKVHLAAALRLAVLDGFDIDICKVSLNWDGRQLCLRMSQVVHDSLKNRCFHCVVQQRCRIPFYCPMQKTMARVLKYYRRGYNFKSIIFLPPTDNVQPSTPTSSHFVVSAAEVTNHA